MTVGKSERVTQDRVIALFRKELGYRFLGDRSDRDNSNIEESLLSEYLVRVGYSEATTSRALYLLRTEANHPNRSLYENNKAVYALLRYGVKVKTAAGEDHETVRVIDWSRPEQNDFAIAEEVTLRGGKERRPDLVLYVNGIALAVIELKNSRVSIGKGIRQLLSNQKKDWNEWFFSTVQVVFAGSDSEGLRYGTIGTEEKYFLTWKEERPGWKPGDPPTTRYLAAEDYRPSHTLLDRALLQFCNKRRFLQLIHDFIVFDAGTKKLCRHNQYFGVRAAQEHIRRREGGILWHTQGSGKSLTMVWLAKWIRENVKERRLDVEELSKIPISIGLMNEDGFPHQGFLNYVSPEIDASTGTILVRGLFSNPNRTLIPGFFVRVKVPKGLKPAASLLVPNRVIGEDQAGIGGVGRQAHRWRGRSLK